MSNIKNPVIFFFKIAMFFNFIYAQNNVSYYHISPDNVKYRANTEIVVLPANNDPISSGLLYFREKNELSYQEIAMEFVAGSWIGTIPGNRVTKPGIEYLVILRKENGGKISVPFADDPFESPLEFIVTDDLNNMSKDNISLNDETDFINSDILILTPEPGSFNPPGEVVIALSLFNATNIDQKNYKLMLDDEDVTDLSIIAGDVLTFVPEKELTAGFHKVEVLFKTPFGLDVKPLEWSFNVNKGMVNFAEAFKYKGSINGKNSINSASGITLAENELNIKFDGELSWVKARYNLKTSSRESPFIQPQNRRALSLQVADYLKLQFGDIYPSISPYLLDGKRVRGQHINLDLPYVSFQYVKGEINRAIQYKNRLDGALKIIENDTKIDSSGDDVVNIYSLTRNGYTFPQDIWATKLSLDVFNFFDFGFHFLKVKDDYEKIQRSVPGSVTFTVDSTLNSVDAGEYSLSQFSQLISLMGDSIFIPEKNWANGSPVENIVLGFDFEKALDNRKLLFQMAWNMSWINNNIWDGPLTWEEADVLLDSLDNDSLLNIPISDGLPDPSDYENIITINPQHMVPLLPIDPITFEKNKIRAIINMPSSAFNIRVKGSYSFNNLLIEYRQIGPEYKSLGNPYLTNNIREFIINDRVSTLGRRLMFSFGYKSRDNNLLETVVSPLSTKTFSFNTTLVPGPGAVSLILNLQSINQNNGIDSLITTNYGAVLKDNREDSQALNTMASINIPSSGATSSSTIAFNLNTITYEDKLAESRDPSYLFQKSDTKSYSAVISTRFDKSLSTSFSINSTSLFSPVIDGDNNISKIESNWFSSTVSANYQISTNVFSLAWLESLLPDFDNKLRIKGGMDYLTNGEKGDDKIRMFGFKFGADLDIIKNLTLSSNMSLRINYAKGNLNDGIDNDQNNKIDDSGESLIINNSGFYMILGYRF